MFVFNFIFWLLGCAVLGTGIWVRADPDFRQYVDNTETFNYLYTGAYILVSVGILIMFIGFLGCFGSLRESLWLLLSFFTALTLILSCLVSTGVWAIMAKDSLKKSVTDTLESAVRHYQLDSKSQTFLENIMSNFKCCGASKGASDFAAVGIIPVPCELANFGAPCDIQVFHYFSENVNIFAGIALVVATIMIIGLSLSMHMFCEIRRKRREEKYAQIHHGLM